MRGEEKRREEKRRGWLIILVLLFIIYMDEKRKEITLVGCMSGTYYASRWFEWLANSEGSFEIEKKGTKKKKKIKKKITKSESNQRSPITL